MLTCKKKSESPTWIWTWGRDSQHQESDTHPVPVHHGEDELNQQLVLMRSEPMNQPDSADERWNF